MDELWGRLDWGIYWSTFSKWWKNSIRLPRNNKKLKLTYWLIIMWSLWCKYTQSRFKVSSWRHGQTFFFRLVVTSSAVSPNLQVSSLNFVDTFYNSDSLLQISHFNWAPLYSIILGLVLIVTKSLCHPRLLTPPSLSLTHSKKENPKALVLKM